MSVESNTTQAHHQPEHATHAAHHSPDHEGEKQTGHTAAHHTEQKTEHHADKAHVQVAALAHHHLLLDAFPSPPKHDAVKHESVPAHTDKAAVHVNKDKVKDHDLETFKHQAASCHKVVMRLIPAHQDSHDPHAKPGDPHAKTGNGDNGKTIQATVEVAADGSLKWHKNPNNHDPHAGMNASKDLVVAFAPSKPGPGGKEGELTDKQIDRLKQMVACLGETHTQTQVDKALQDKAHVHIIPTDKQDKDSSDVLISARRHGSHDPATGQWSGGNGSLYKKGQSEKWSEPPATARAHLGNAGGEETTFMQTVTPADRPQIKDFVDKLVWAISGNEGNYTTVNPNDAGHGISIGIRQWNQKSGELPELLRSWHDHDPAKFESIFGHYSGDLLNEHFVRGTDFWRQPGLMEDVKKALADQEFQQVQLDLARQFVVNSVQLGYDNGFRSELALADIADVINQCGSGGFTRALKHGIKMAGSEQDHSCDGDCSAETPGQTATKQAGKNVQRQHASPRPNRLTFFLQRRSPSSCTKVGQQIAEPRGSEMDYWLQQGTIFTDNGDT